MGERGISEQELQFGGNLSNEKYESALRQKKAYSENSLLTFKLYFVTLLGDIVGPVLNNNGFPAIGTILFGIGLVASLVYLIFLFKSFSNLQAFYKLTPDRSYINIYALLVLGIPLYFLIYFYYKNKLKEDIKTIR